MKFYCGFRCSCSYYCCFHHNNFLKYFNSFIIIVVLAMEKNEIHLKKMSESLEKFLCRQLHHLQIKNYSFTICLLISTSGQSRGSLAGNLFCFFLLTTLLIFIFLHRSWSPSLNILNNILQRLWHILVCLKNAFVYFTS